MLITIVIPAYNESQNLKILVKNIFGNLNTAGVIIVDDSTLEKEKEELRKISQKYPAGSVKIIFRGQKSGRGSAVMDGLKASLKDKETKYFFEMDADLSHDPKELKLFLDKKNKADMIIGSRYLNTSHIVKWPWWRVLQSRIINKILNVWLGLKITDYTDGYRLYSRKAVEYLCQLTLKEKGFIALSEIAFRLKKKGFKISEVPISFTDRTFGKSNANIKELLNSLAGAVRIRFY